MTGLYVHNHRVRTNHSLRSLDQSKTIQGYLRRNGYATGYFGKFFNLWPEDRPPPYFSSWATFVGGQFKAYRNGPWNVNGDIRTIETYATTFIRQRATGFLRSTERTSDRRPWLMYVGTTAPHAPYTPDEPYEDAVTGRWDGNPAVFERVRRDKPPSVRRDTRRLAYGRRTRRNQLRTLMSVDDMIRSVFTTMRSLGEARNTLAFFVSDNGYMWGEHGLGGKRRPYLQSSGVPMFLRWPARIPGGTRDPRLSAVIDIAPTILHAAGIGSGRMTDGRSLLRRGWERKRLLIELGPEPEYDHWASLVRQSDQYVEYYGREGGTFFREYYDLAADPWQLRNLLRDGRPRNDPPVGRLSRILTGDRRCHRYSCP